MKVLEANEAKAKNKRILIQLAEREDGIKVFLVETKTLIDFKSRHILNTKTCYSIETFAILSNLFESFLNAPIIKNKHLLKELDELYKQDKISVATTMKQ
ncbi:hypothetical protein [Wenyingzhuangia sp. 2_MG-2023]|uniref:hypothetical protein n=1 Tax=Wenyingzhuangia sp. 2_MG-2023 TaxID=3062639 RepID=UPI0026E39126|nr:hypothetical protein [Wenyingzhuangia sp. 2_MG-2023]MDO6737076.1 hypothetical protein [Wenyingzhuangia sp. 2_MG-2023]